MTGWIMDKEMKIGIVTFYRYNYGSILQCYASCEVLQQKGYQPVVLDAQSDRIKIILRMARRSLAHPKHVPQFYQIWKSQRAKSLKSLSEEGLSMMECFVEERLPGVRIKTSELKQLGKSKGYLAFLSGSDQIWSGVHFLIPAHFFLRFAPIHKRVAWAPSFGTNDVAVYNKRCYKKYITQYAALSVREERGVELVQELTGKTPKLLIDPVFLLKGDEWQSLTAENIYGEYALCYFLDDPNVRTLEKIEEFCNQEHLKPVVLGCMRDVYSKLSGCRTIDGGPEEFLTVIRHTRCLFTDSFHATSFAIIFHTSFFAFRRNYTHGVDQSSRLKSILHMCQMEGAFDATTLNHFDYSFAYADTVIATKRREMLEFLDESIEKAREGADCNG